MHPLRRTFNQRCLTSSNVLISSTVTRSIANIRDEKQSTVIKPIVRFITQQVPRKKQSIVSQQLFHSDPFNALKKNKFSNEGFHQCFQHFDSQKQGIWTRPTFHRFLNALFSNKGQPYIISNELVEHYFQQTDFKRDNKIDFDEFLQTWEKTIKYAIKPVTALVIIDVQNDFISGTLALHTCPSKHRGEEVVPVINKLIRDTNFDVIVYSYDWHPENHISFYENLHLRQVAPESPISADKAHAFDTVTFVGSSHQAKQREQILWPRHCVEKTYGAALHNDLIVVDNAVNVYKGTNSEIDSYSAFWDNMKLSKTTLDEQLKQRSITDVYVVGLATDACVAASAMHSIENNYRTVVIEDACRGIDLKQIEKKKKELIENNCVIVDSDKVRDMVSGVDRRPEMTRGVFTENLKSLGRYNVS